MSSCQRFIGSAHGWARGSHFWTFRLACVEVVSALNPRNPDKKEQFSASMGFEVAGLMRPIAEGSGLDAWYPQLSARQLED